MSSLRLIVDAIALPYFGISQIFHFSFHLRQPPAGCAFADAARWAITLIQLIVTWLFHISFHSFLSFHFLYLVISLASSWYIQSWSASFSSLQLQLLFSAQAFSQLQILHSLLSFYFHASSIAFHFSFIDTYISISSLRLFHFSLLPVVRLYFILSFDISPLFRHFIFIFISILIAFGWHYWLLILPVFAVRFSRCRAFDSLPCAPEVPITDWYVSRQSRGDRDTHDETHTKNNHTPAQHAVTYFLYFSQLNDNRMRWPPISFHRLLQLLFTYFSLIDSCHFFTLLEASALRASDRAMFSISLSPLFSRSQPAIQAGHFRFLSDRAGATHCSHWLKLHYW